MNSVALCLSTKLKSIRMTLNIWREMDERTQTMIIMNIWWTEGN